MRNVHKVIVPLIRTILLKGTKCPLKDMTDLPCLMQLLTWLHVSHYRNFETMK